MDLTDNTLDTRDIRKHVEEEQDLINCMREDLSNCFDEELPEALRLECATQRENALYILKEKVRELVSDIISQAEDLHPWSQFVEEYEDEIEDFLHGALLIADDYFEDYTEQMARDVVWTGDANWNAWPLNCIDWSNAAEQLQQDYMNVTIDGHEFWVR